MAAFISMFARSIPYITQAIYAGHTASVMLNHFSRSSKRIQEQILSARSSGYDDSQILTHMIKAGESAHMKALKGAGHKTKRERDESFTKAASLAKKAVAAAGIAAAAYGGYKYANRAVRPSEILPAQGGQQRQLTGPGGGQLPAPRQPPQLPNLPPSIPPQGQVITPPYSGPPGAAPFSKLNVNPAAGQTPGRAVSQQVIQPTPRAIIPPVPQARQQPQDKLGELESLLGNMGAQSQGQIPVPEAQMLPPEAKPYGKSQVPQAPTVGDATPEFDAWIERFKQPEEPMYPPVVKDIMPQPLSKEAPPPKNDLVETPNGDIGTVKSISGNKALIEVNGKMQPVEISSLKGQPDAIKKAKFVFDPSLIPESTKSAALAQVIPLPSNEGVVVRFHGSNPYMYHRKDGSPIPNDIIRSLIDGTEIPMTSGNTFLGNWDATVGDSRGSSNFKNLKNMAQSPEEAQSNPDPNKPLIFEELKDNFLHGLYKDFESSMIEVDKAFKAKKKEPKANETKPAKPVKKTVSNNLSKVSDDKNQQPLKENEKMTKERNNMGSLSMAALKREMKKKAELKEKKSINSDKSQAQREISRLKNQAKKPGSSQSGINASIEAAKKRGGLTKEVSPEKKKAESIKTFVEEENFRGDPIPLDKVPDKLYHVTTKKSAIDKDKMIKRGLGGGLGGVHKVVSFTSDKEIAKNLKNDVKLAATYFNKFKDNFNPLVAYKYLQNLATKEGWTFEHIYDYPENKDFKKDLKREEPLTLLKEYFKTRERTIGKKNPVILKEILANPEDVDIIEVSKSDLPINSNVRTGDDFLKEVAVYNDIPL